MAPFSLINLTTSALLTLAISYLQPQATKAKGWNKEKSAFLHVGLFRYLYTLLVESLS